MALPGPAPTPSAIKAMLGNKDINKHEPRPAEVKATPPRSLQDKDARKLYKVLAAELCRLGLLTRIDVPDLGSACWMWTEADRLEQQYPRQSEEGQPGAWRRDQPCTPGASLCGWKHGRCSEASASVLRPTARD
jgi:hypothetical protein